MSVELTLNDEELEELQELMLSEQKQLLIEIRRSSPNSPFKAQLRHRVEIVDSILERLASAHKTAA